MQLVSDIWQNFRSLPVWVQIWVFGVLVPVNAASIFFVAEPSGLWIAVLAVGAMLINVPVMIIERGFPKVMALSHLPLWTPLVIWLIVARPEGSSAYQTYLWILLVVDLVSLGFDYPDAWRWWKGERDVT